MKQAIAFPSVTSHYRHRDIWDLAWLTQQGAKPNLDLIRLKIEDYSVNNYSDLLDQAIVKLPDVIDSPEFLSQMSRFLDDDRLNDTLRNERFMQYLKGTVNGVFTETKKRLASEDNNEDEHFEFRM